MGRKVRRNAMGERVSSKWKGDSQKMDGWMKHLRLLENGEGRCE